MLGVLPATNMHRRNKAMAGASQCQFIDPAMFSAGSATVLAPKCGKRRALTLAEGGRGIQERN